jgi:hypothetical protein
MCRRGCERRRESECEREYMRPDLDLDLLCWSDKTAIEFSSSSFSARDSLSPVKGLLYQIRGTANSTLPLCCHSEPAPSHYACAYI